MGLFIISACGGKRADKRRVGYQPMYEARDMSKIKKSAYSFKANRVGGAIAGERQPQHNTEEYNRIYDNNFLAAKTNPLSTFSIDVDTASFSNMRRYIRAMHQMPPKDAIRIEELVNYFDYNYEGPKDGKPFSVHTEISACPWNKKNKLIHIGLQGKKVATENIPPMNLVFLLDVSGSMSSYNKLPLLKKSFKLLLKQMRESDRIAIVVYAGAAGVVLPSTSNKEKIMEALDNLQAGGSTAGGAGIKLAYKIAKENFIKNGNNRIIIATDGDFNVGVSSSSDLVRMIEKRRDQGIYLTVLGFGMGNYKGGRMEQLADKGNGNYAYIDNIMEAKKVLVQEMGGTLLTIAKDVKIQVEFNPTKVKSYRLIGYVNRKMAKEDFNNDKKDAGELGAGHTVTALYEIVPAKGSMTGFKVDNLRYQETKIKVGADESNEIMLLKLRYKKPKESQSNLLVFKVYDEVKSLEKASHNFKFSAAVASFGMLLRDSEFKGKTTYKSVLALAKNSKGDDKHGYRADFIKLVEEAQLLN